MICLPYPRTQGPMSFEEALYRRRSIRRYFREPLTIEELSQLLWAAYGKSHWEFLTTPSAGATYPLVVYAAVDNVEGLEPGVYKYLHNKHCLIQVKEGSVNEELYEACLKQRWVLEAPLNIVLTAIFRRTTMYYGKRGERYVWMEFGHASQNIYLQATALGLGTVAVGAFYDEMVLEAVNASEEEMPGYVMPVGRVKLYQPPPIEELYER